MIDKRTDCSEDFVIFHTHESKCNPMNSNYTYSVVAVFASKAAADKECAKSKYEWNGNSSGSVSWKVIPRSEVPDAAKFEC